MRVKIISEHECEWTLLEEEIMQSHFNEGGEMIKVILPNGEKRTFIDCDFLKRQEVDIDKAFLLAADNGQTDAVRLLLQMGADVHADDDDVLCRAAEEGKLEIVKCLVEYGCAGKDKAIRLAERERHVDIVKYLQDVDIHKTEDETLKC